MGGEVFRRQGCHCRAYLSSLLVCGGVQQGEDGGPWSLVSSVQGAAQVAARGGGTLGQKLAELCPPVSTQINLHTGTKLK